MAGYGYEGTACETNAAREPDVVAAFARLGDATGYLTETVAVLEKRLSPVTGPESPVNACGEKLPAPGLCTISQGAYEQAARVKDATNRIRDLLDRLEI